MAKIRNIYDFSALINMGLDRNKFIILFSFLFCEFSGFSQTAYRDQEFSIATENDVYLLKNNDRYYSNGILINYRFIPGSGTFFNRQNHDSVKLIVAIELTQKFFTPIGLQLIDPNAFDRPYAGLLYGGVTVSRFIKDDRLLTYGFELGTTGRASGAEAFQKWYHQFAGFPRPLGWDFQIKNELIVGLKGEYNRQFWLLPKTIDLVTQSKVNLGTAFINTHQGIDVRFGKLQPLAKSAFKNALIGKGSDRFIGHNYFFFGYGVEYLAHNTLIQGSIWNDNSPHTEDVFNWVRHWRLGWAANSETTTFKMTYYHLSKEVVGAQNHAYIGFELQLRFRPSKQRRYPSELTSKQ